MWGKLKHAPHPHLSDALLMTILPQTFLPFVGGHFMALTLFSAWHFWRIMKYELWSMNFGASETVPSQESFPELIAFGLK